MNLDQLPFGDASAFLDQLIDANPTSLLLVLPVLFDNEPINPAFQLLPETVNSYSHLFQDLGSAADPMFSIAQQLSDDEAPARLQPQPSEAVSPYNNAPPAQLYQQLFPGGEFFVAPGPYQQGALPLKQELPKPEVTTPPLPLPQSQDNVLAARTLVSSAGSADGYELAGKRLQGTKAAASGSRVAKPSKKDRLAHNMIEKKYRTNINAKIVALRDAVPALRIVSGLLDMLMVDLDGLTPASKLNKASVLTKATEYIKHLEKKNEGLMLENAELRRMLGLAAPPPLTASSQYAPGQYPPNTAALGSAPQIVLLQPYIQPQSAAVVPAVEAPPPGAVSLYPVTYNMGMGVPEKIVMGGMAAMMAGNMYTGGDGDFRGLLAFPLLLHPALGLLVTVFKVMLVALAVSLVVLRNDRAPGDKPRGWSHMLKLLVHANEGEPPTKDMAMVVQARLVGEDCLLYLWFALFVDYLWIAFSSRLVFENVFVSAVVGEVLMCRFPWLRPLGLGFLLLLDHRTLQKLQFLVPSEYVELHGLVSGPCLARLFVLQLYEPIVYRREGVLDMPEVMGDSKVNKSLFTLVPLLVANQLLKEYCTEFLQKTTHHLKREREAGIVDSDSDHHTVGSDADSDATDSDVTDDDNMSGDELTLVDVLVLDLKRQFAQVVMEGLRVHTQYRLFTAASHPTFENVADARGLVQRSLNAHESVPMELYVMLVAALVSHYGPKHPDQVEELVRFLRFRASGPQMTLFLFAAVYRLLTHLSLEVFQNDSEGVLEELMVAARVWIGRAHVEDRTGLSVALRGALGDQLVRVGVRVCGFCTPTDAHSDSATSA